MLTIYKNFPENPVGTVDETRLFESFHWKISGSNGKGNPVFSGRNVPNGNSCSISLKPSLIPVLGLRGRFLVNRTDIYVQNGKRDSETKFTISEFCVPFTRTVNRPVYPCKC